MVFESRADDFMGSINCVKLSCDIDGFQDWLSKEHGIKNFEPIFEGYKFFLETSIRSFMNSIIYNSSLGLEEDYIFFRARFKGIDISKIPNTSEKLIFIKNVNDRMELIKKSKNMDELRKSVKIFSKEVIAVFDNIYQKNTVVSEKVNFEKDEILRSITIFFTYIYLNDISRQIPHGYWLSVLDNSISVENYHGSFDGYKYSLQFLWFSLLGEGYSSSSVKNLHNVKLWFRDESSSDETTGSEHERNEPKSIDDYFSIIREEIVLPIEEKTGSNFPFDNLLVLNKFSSEIFGVLVKPGAEPVLTEKEKLDYNLLWYEIEILDSRSIFNGVPAFITLLIGQSESKRMFGEGEKARICKFVHPTGENGKNDYSYGVLIEAFGSLGISDYSGWIIFFDCCGDYSGFSGSLQVQAETFINEMKRKGLIDLVEMTVNKDFFKRYIKSNLVSSRNEMFLEEDESSVSDNEPRLLQYLKTQSEEPRRREVIAEARGMILELLAYYTHSRKPYEDPIKLYGNLEWNVKKNGDQLDVILETERELVLIESVVNPSSMDLDDEISKLEEKLSRLSTDKDKKCEFWFWNEPHPQTVKKLEGRVNHRVFSQIINTSSVWKGKEKEKLKTIFGKTDK